MRATVWIPLAAALCAGLAFTGGCVSLEEHNKVLAANRRVNEELTTCKAELARVSAEHKQLSEDLEDMDSAVSAKDGQIESLQKETALLKTSMKQLEERIAVLGELSEPPPVIDIRLPTAVHQALQKFAEANTQIVEYLPKHGMVKFKADLTFERGSDSVTGEAKEALGKFVEILTGQAAAEFNVYVAGHTDDIPILKPATKKRHPNNWYLSVHRAVAVEKILAKAGLIPERIGVMGFGEYHPIAPNAPGKKGNRLNRRVEIWILPPDRFLTAAAPLVEEK